MSKLLGWKTEGSAKKKIPFFVDVYPLNNSEDEPVISAWPITTLTQHVPELSKGCIRYRVELELDIPLATEEIYAGVVDGKPVEVGE